MFTPAVIRRSACSAPAVSAKFRRSRCECRSQGRRSVAKRRPDFCYSSGSVDQPITRSNPARRAARAAYAAFAPVTTISCSFWRKVSREVQGATTGRLPRPQPRGRARTRKLGVRGTDRCPTPAGAGVAGAHVTGARLAGAAHVAGRAGAAAVRTSLKPQGTWPVGRSSARRRAGKPVAAGPKGPAATINFALTNCQNPR